MKSKSLTKELLQLMGSPFVAGKDLTLDQATLAMLQDYSEKNKILFHFLETVKRKNVKNLSSVHQREDVRYLKMLDVIARTSRVLRDTSVDHVFFKTVRPYKSTTVDLDILVLEDKASYENCIEAIQKAGYELVVRGPMSTTFWDREADIGIDMYTEIAASSVIYMDKRKLVNHATNTKLPSGECLRVFGPEADLACIIAHSVIKEQMYVLSEYYTFIHYLERVNLEDFLDLVRQNNITSATRAHASITLWLHNFAHDNVPDKLERIVNSLGRDDFETGRLTQNRYKTPYKYHPITLIKSLLEISKGKETRKSMANQCVRAIFDLGFSKDLMEKIIDHIFRGTY
jgi:hypothetical protein